jgi:hypothetical protein
MGIRHRPYAPTLRGIIIKRAVSASLAVLRAMPLGIEAEAQRHEGRIAARRGAGLRPLVRALFNGRIAFILSSLSKG